MKEQYPYSSASLAGMQEAIATDDELLREVEEIEQHLRLIRRETHRVIEDDRRRTPLTPPQTQAMIALIHANHPGGLTLKDLSERVGLAHSTVSGIVDRLERQGLVRRLVNPADRRSTRIDVTDSVKAYIQQQLPAHLHGPLLDALRRATRAERAAILTGLSTLRRLLTAAEGQDNT
jgi:MarR family transcriptional regulator, organic hydroperoxide resistance regulator